MNTGLFLVALFIGVASSFPSFQNMIPNGGSVPNPCNMGTWAGVGHTAVRGAGPRNLFGLVIGFKK